jgi:hypothetical protein
MQGEIPCTKSEIRNPKSETNPGHHNSAEGGHLLPRVVRAIPMTETLTLADKSVLNFLLL